MRCLLNMWPKRCGGLQQSQNWSENAERRSGLSKTSIAPIEVSEQCLKPAHKHDDMGQTFSLISPFKRC